MKKLLYIIPMLLLAAACTKEPAVQEPEAIKVPLNIMIETKAGGSDSGDEATPYDVNSIRVAVFKSVSASDPTKDLVLVNEFYPNGFEIIGSDKKQADSTYTVAVRPVPTGSSKPVDESLRRNMAQITVEGIESIATDEDTLAAELPKIFVLDVKLVNVPSDMTWSAAQGSTTGGKFTLPIGEANTTKGYYDRNWDGSVYRDVNVTMNRLDEPDIKLYRTGTGANTTSAWGFSGPYRYHYETVNPTEPTINLTDPGKPVGFPEIQGNGKYKYTYWDGNDNKEKKDVVDYATALAGYRDKPPHVKNGKADKNGSPGHLG